MGTRATRLGEVLNETYQLDELIRAEGHVEVYRAIDTRTRAAVFVKLLRPEFALQTELVDSVLRRPRLLGHLVHESLPLVRVDSDETGIPFVVEETVLGRTLADLMETFPQGLPVPLVCQLSLPLVEALALAHQHRLTHGALDGVHIKLLGAADALQPKLVGLGADPALAEQDAAYRAPESKANGAPAPQSDVFALGVLFYKMLSGALPFRAGTLSAIPLEELAPQLSPSWSQLTAACLRVHPKDRLTDAGAVLRSLERCAAASSRPSPAPKPSAPVRSSPATAATQPSTPARSSPAAAATQPSTPARSSPAAAATQASPSKPASGAPRESARASARASASAGPQRVLTIAPESRPSAQDIADRLSAKRSAANQNSSKPAPGREHGSPLPAAPSEVSSSRPAPARTSPRPPVALTRAQLDSLRALRRLEEEDEERSRWLALFFALLFVLALCWGVPLLYDADLERAQAVFGSKLRLGAAGLSIVTVVGALRPWIGRLGRRSALQVLRSLLLPAVACCVVVIAATLYSDAPGLALAASYARRWLPWGMGLLLSLFALDYALRGVRQLGRDLVFGALVLGLSGASTCGSYLAVVRAVANEKQRALKPQPAATASVHRDAAPVSPDESLTTGTGSPPVQPPQTQQRNEVGANEQEDLRPIEELERARSHDKQALERLGKGLPSGVSEPAR